MEFDEQLFVPHHLRLPIFEAQGLGFGEVFCGKCNSSADRRFFRSRPTVRVIDNPLQIVQRFSGRCPDLALDTLRYVEK